MKRNIVFAPQAWEDFQFFLGNDRKTCIDSTNRLVYRITETDLELLQMRYHYGK